MNIVERPTTLNEIAKQSESLEDFGLLFRDWIHHITRGDISNRPALQTALIDPPRILAGRFDHGNVCDAFLGAYAEWICDVAGIAKPKWIWESSRYLEDPWFADNARKSLLVLTPSAFRNHGIYTIPENIVKLRRGRPKVDPEEKRRKARQRDRRYRQRIRNLVDKARANGLDP